jgi:hypothetical protein
MTEAAIKEADELFEAKDFNKVLNRQITCITCGVERKRRNKEEKRDEVGREEERRGEMRREEER